MSTILDRVKLEDAIDLALADVKNELMSAMLRHGSMKSPHEGWAVIMEECEELWDEIKKKHGGRDEAAAKEAVQVAAMAVRYLLDVALTLPGTPAA
jgi:NTP pyrophosphatase (non-canonical NTP hydrolase)